jgi:hypothetical protein
VNYFIYTNQSIPVLGKGILIAGDSHTQTSLNPKYFSKAENISQPAEPYVLTFWKLKRILNTHNPDTLILGFAPHNISQFNDLKFSHHKWSGEMFRRSYTIENYKEIENRVSVDYSTFYRTLIKQIAFYPKRDHIHFLGEYENDTVRNSSDWKSAINRHYYFNEKELSFSDVAINYLDSISTLCNSKRITLVLVSNPVHKNYQAGIPESIWLKYSELQKNYETEFLVIDKTNEIYPDSLFLNSDHLNEDGATRFTNEVIDRLNEVRAQNYKFKK